MLSLRLQTPLHKKKSFSMLSQLSWDKIAQGKTLGSVVPDAPDNTAQEKILFNVILILLGQYCTEKTLCNVVIEAPEHIAQEKNPF